MVFGLGFEHPPSSHCQMLFVFERQPSDEYSTAQEYKVRVQDITTTVIINAICLTFEIQALYLRTIDPRFAGLINQIGQQIQSATDATGTEVGKEILQIDMSFKVIAISCLFK